MAHHSLSHRTIRNHYQRIQYALAPLGSLGDNPTLLVNDKEGWYITRSISDQSEDPNNTSEFPKERRARDFQRDYSRVVTTQLERTLYALTSYKNPISIEHWEPARFDAEKGEYEYLNQKPIPTVEDTAAISAWGDIDLTDELKPNRFELSEKTYATMEAALEMYIDAFAELYGGRDAVYALDSVGGAFVFGAPEATLPISQYYKNDADARERIFSAFIERTNNYLEGVEEQVNDRLEGAAGVTDPDWANNKNRSYKVPLALHSELDAVVTPIDIDDVQYRKPVGPESVDDALVEEVRSWCETFTTIEYGNRVENLVATLWPEEYNKYGSWTDALDTWIEIERENERKEELRQRTAAKRREERLENLAENGSLKNQSVTPFMQDIYDSIDALDVEDVAGETIVYAWTDEVPGKTDNSGGGKRAFVPSWRHSSNGTACYIDEKGSWNDTKKGWYGTIIEAALIATGQRSPQEGPADGMEWMDGVDALRDLGFEIPLWTPEKGSQHLDSGTYDQMPFWAMKKAAVALNVVPEDAFVKKCTDTGGEYLGFPGRDTYNSALEAIEDAGIEHGRKSTHAHGPIWLNKPLPDVDLDPRTEVSLSDEELINKAHEASNGEKFSNLWSGDTNGYETHEQADIALCHLLAFWTGGNGHRMDRLFRKSGLMREKWNSEIPIQNPISDRRETRLTYGENAIRRAIAEKKNFYRSPSNSRSDVDQPEHGIEPQESRSNTDSDVNSGNRLKSRVVTLRKEIKTKQKQINQLEGNK